MNLLYRRILVITAIGWGRQRLTFLPVDAQEKSAYPFCQFQSI